MAQASARRQLHAALNAERAARLAKGVYGPVGQPVLAPGAALCEPPGYAAAAKTARYASQRKNGFDDGLDRRCFFTGVVLDDPPPGEGVDRDPRKMPFIGTRDHLVPLRRELPGEPPALLVRRPTLVWASNVANVTLGLAPTMVRLKVREWLSTANFDRADRSVDAGLNLRWLIIHYLDYFRIRGRYPWSRDARGRWWNPEFQGPFMARMLEAEARFLAMSAEDRDGFVRRFTWQF